MGWKTAVSFNVRLESKVPSHMELGKSQEPHREEAGGSFGS